MLWLRKKMADRLDTCAGLLLFYSFIFQLSMMTTTGLAMVRCRQLQPVKVYPRQSGDTEPRNLMIFHKPLFFYDIVRCLLVYTYANDKSDTFEHDS